LLVGLLENKLTPELTKLVRSHLLGLLGRLGVCNWHCRVSRRLLSVRLRVVVFRLYRILVDTVVLLADGSAVGSLPGTPVATGLLANFWSMSMISRPIFSTEALASGAGAAGVVSEAAFSGTSEVEGVSAAPSEASSAFLPPVGLAGSVGRLLLVLLRVVGLRGQQRSDSPCRVSR
jgi:hypothetical protein